MKTNNSFLRALRQLTLAQIEARLRDLRAEEAELSVLARSLRARQAALERAARRRPEKPEEGTSCK